MSAIKAIGEWKTNAEMIRDIGESELPYLTKDGWTLDPTYGLGTFWDLWAPETLIGTDIDPEKSPINIPDDFTKLRFLTGEFDSVVFDPPYKLNGTPDPYFDNRYGVHFRTTVTDRLKLMEDGLIEAIRVTKVGGYILVKCQDQVVSGAVVWQTDLMKEVARRHGAAKVDRFEFLSYRAQPHGRSQKHARRNHSTLLVFRKLA